VCEHFNYLDRRDRRNRSGWNWRTLQGFHDSVQVAGEFAWYSVATRRGNGEGLWCWSADPPSQGFIPSSHWQAP
jgi:hypothetical protein